MKKFDFANKKLMTPGPVPIPQEIKDIFIQYDCHHRTKEFTEVLTSVFNNLKKLFQTEQHCYLLASTGTGAMEASFVNTIKTSDSVLFINSGKFGERWGKLASAYKIKNTSIDFEWGKNIDLNRVREHLKTKKYQALAFQACETSTGASLPVKELCALAQEFDVLSLVDGITALGAVNLPMDEWGIDVLLGGSQKAFMLPTGMSFLSLSKKAEEIKSDLPKFYFDLKAEKKSNLEQQTRWSTPTHFILGLSLVLENILQKKGLQKHFAEIEDKAQYFRKSVKLPLFPETSCSSLTCLKIPEGKSASQIKKDVLKEGFVIMAGQDQLADKVLRIGHMGDISKEDLLNTAQAINKHI
jgi:serine---pyruvate transaminase